MGHASSFRPQRSSSDDTASARNNGRHNCRMLENQRGRWVCDLHVDVPELCAQLLQQVGVHQGGDGGAGFSFPIFYTMWNTFASFLGANLLMVLVPANRTISWKQFVDNKFALLVFGVVFSSNIVTNNASLVHISLSVNQVIKCLVPIPAIIFSFFIEKKPPYWAKQDWERVVKKGNSPYNDKQVEKAMQIKGEPIRVPSEGARDKADAAEAKAEAIIASENKA